MFSLYKNIYVIKLSIQTIGLDAIKGHVTCELRDLVICRMMV